MPIPDDGARAGLAVRADRVAPLKWRTGCAISPGDSPARASNTTDVGGAHCGTAIVSSLRAHEPRWRRLPENAQLQATLIDDLLDVSRILAQPWTCSVAQPICLPSCRHQWTASAPAARAKNTQMSHCRSSASHLDACGRRIIGTRRRRRWPASQPVIAPRSHGRLPDPNGSIPNTPFGFRISITVLLTVLCWIRDGALE